MGDAAVLMVRGDLMGGPETGEVLDRVRHLVSGGTRKIVLDLAKVRWMNSHGMGMLMGCYSSIQKAGGSILLAGMSPKVEEIMQITKVHRLFDHFRSVQEALRSFE